MKIDSHKYLWIGGFKCVHTVDYYVNYVLYKSADYEKKY